jgi:simple sugar transport system substrate-binding protein
MCIAARRGHTEEVGMNRPQRLVVALASAALIAGVPVAASAQEEGQDLTFYVVTHGAASDPYWVIVTEAAQKAGSDLGVNVQVSLAQNDIAAQKEAFNAAIAAGADGIAVSSPETGAFVGETAAAIEAGIPVVYLDTDDPTSGRLAYVGADLFLLGSTWASYLVDNGLVESGDFVWMPVEVPGAAYQVLATEGVSSVFDPLGIEYQVFDAGYDPAQSLANMTDYLTSNRDEVDGIIGLGDLVMTNIRSAFDSAGIAAGEIPVVGWGSTNETANEVKDGYVNAATWAYPDAAGYDSVVLLFKASTGLTIGYDIPTQTLYEASTADKYVELTQ